MASPTPGDSDPGQRTWRVEGVPRLLAVGDVQSNADALRALLLEAGYLAERGGDVAWAAEGAALLFTGDLLDGGVQPAETLELLREIDAAARSGGGRLVLLKGNHELMMLAALRPEAEDAAAARELWFANGGLETLVRLAHARGHAVSGDLVAQMFTPSFGGPDPEDPEVERLVRFVADGWAEEIDLIRTQARAAALVNGSVLAFHGAPNETANRFAEFCRDDAEEAEIAWGRDWLGAQRLDSSPGLAERLRALKRRLDSPDDGVALRHVVFGHTELGELEVPGFRGRQYRIGRLVPPAADRPALYCLMTAPRAIAPGGALGGLEFSARGVTAVYGAPIDLGGGRPVVRDPLGDPVASFAT